MSSKRKLPSLGLQRRVRPRKEDDNWETHVDAREDSSSEEVEEEGIRGENGEYDNDGEEYLEIDDADEDELESGSGSDDESDPEEESAAPKIDLSSVSFGALARAQASMHSKRKSKADKTSSTTAANEDAQPFRDDKPDRGQRPKKELDLKRSSKHAPQEQSSKRPVTRRREVVSEPGRRQARDPRFDPTTAGRQFDEEKAKKAYAFLDEYRDREMADLRAEIKKTKDAGAKERLKRQLMSMESKKKASKRKEEADNLLREHRRREKELVAQGKQPFYLKKNEQQKKLLMDRYASMSKGQVDRAIERKRKKVAGKEKKELDFLTRRS